MKKLLMLNASMYEIPLIYAAKELGFYVITTGNNSSAPGHKAADEYAPFDYSDYDGMVNLAQKIGIDAISQGCSDNCALVAAYMGEKLGLKGHDTFENAQIIHRKDYFKKFVKDNGIKSPVAECFEDVNQALNYDTQDKYPLIIKPSDQAGGKGVSRVDTRDEYEQAIKKAFGKSNIGHVVIEPFLQGTLHSFCSFIVNEKVAAYSTWNDYSFKNGFLTNSGLCPADDWKEAVSFLIPQVEKIAKKLGLVDGLLHLQYMKCGHEYWIIEMMRRMPGNNSTTAAAYSTGVNWNHWIIKAEAGQSCCGIPSFETMDRYYGYHSIMSDGNGIFEGVSIKEEFKKYIIDIEMYDDKGAEINDYLYQKFGLVQFYLNSKEEKDKYMGEINGLIRCIRSES